MPVIRSCLVRGKFELGLLKSLGSGWTRLGGYVDCSPLREFFNIPMTLIEPVVQPDGVGNDIWRESVVFVCVHLPILPVTGF